MNTDSRNIPQTSGRWRVTDASGTDYGTFPSYSKATRFAYALADADRSPEVGCIDIRPVEPFLFRYLGDDIGLSRRVPATIILRDDRGHHTEASVTDALEFDKLIDVGGFARIVAALAFADSVGNLHPSDAGAWERLRPMGAV
ncbi:hypothetical protein [Caballeronia sp. INSB1]|uniref:hypothetical protein n=1 Tax=Caballeronia sp. INSB1 TaxID=2921751 RepID=UPI002032D963|nr:hypothetical protein [Caballeronia sp. INSB1]